MSRSERGCKNAAVKRKLRCQGVRIITSSSSLPSARRPCKSRQMTLGTRADHFLFVFRRRRNPSRVPARLFAQFVSPDGFVCINPLAACDTHVHVRVDSPGIKELDSRCQPFGRTSDGYAAMQLGAKTHLSKIKRVCVRLVNLVFRHDTHHVCSRSHLSFV